MPVRSTGISGQGRDSAPIASRVSLPLPRAASTLSLDRWFRFTLALSARREEDVMGRGEFRTLCARMQSLMPSLAAVAVVTPGAEVSGREAFAQNGWDFAGSGTKN